MGVAISLAIYATGAVSGAHMTAMTIAFAWRGFPWRRCHVLSLVGAIAGAAVLCLPVQQRDRTLRGGEAVVARAASGELSAMVYGSSSEPLWSPVAPTVESVTLLQAMLAEAIGTAFLAFFVFAVVDERNPGRPNGTLFALFIGLTVSIIISIVAPLTQAGLNPARDFGPRLFSFFAGWGEIAIPGPRGGFFTVYILAPIVGAVVGSAIYERLVRPALPPAEAQV